METIKDLSAKVRDAVTGHFDKMLLSALFLIVLGIAVHVIHHGAADGSSVQWIENIVGQVLAALLTLMVGQRMTPRNGDNGSDLSQKK